MNIRVLIKNLVLVKYHTSPYSFFEGGVANPNVLLLDEPFSALDLDMSIKLISDVRNLLKDRSCPSILVTHNVKEAKLFSDRIIDLSKA